MSVNSTTRAYKYNRNARINTTWKFPCKYLHETRSRDQWRSFVITWRVPLKTLLVRYFRIYTTKPGISDVCAYVTFTLSNVRCVGNVFNVHLIVRKIAHQKKICLTLKFPLLGKIITPTCPYWEIIDDVPHILSECVKNGPYADSSWAKIWGNCNTDLDSPFSEGTRRLCAIYPGNQIKFSDVSCPYY